MGWPFYHSETTRLAGGTRGCFLRPQRPRSRSVSTTYYPEVGEAFAEAVEASRKKFDEDYEERQRDLFGQ